MINKDKIVFNEHTYYTCGYSGAIGIKILKFFEDGCVLVKTKTGTFVRPLMYVYNTEEDARKGGRNGNIMSESARRVKGKIKKFPHKWGKVS